MAKTRMYQHYCPVARSLEVIGEKWSLLIVRDLLGGAQRFTDLLRYEGGITPKWLTLRLRDLEAAGIVERDSEAGRREVWYRLTPKGRDLAPVVESLALWGIEHAQRPPQPGEPIHPGQITNSAVIFLNSRHVQLARPVTYVISFAPDRLYSVHFDGERWSIKRGDAEADLRIETTPEDWVAFLRAEPDERPQRARQLCFEGDADRIDEFIRTFGLRQPTTSVHPTSVPA
jgi:DNA-binding HxlR family transcriptional regulator